MDDAKAYHALVTAEGREASLVTRMDVEESGSTPPDGVDAATRLADAAAHYASTPEGAVRVKAEADARTGAGDVETGALLGQAVQQGQRIRQAAQDTAGIVRGATPGSGGIRQKAAMIPRNYKVVLNYPEPVGGHSHTTVRLEWQRTTATGQKAGVAICECGAEQRIMQYAKDVKRSRRR